MNRRTLLRGIATGAAGLAGCITPRARRGDGPADRRRRVSVAGRDDTAHGIRMDVELLRATVTDDRTARLAITTTNAGPRRALSVGTDGCALLNRSEGRSDNPAGLWLYRDGQTEWLERDGRKWEPDRSADEPRAYPAYGCGPTTYDSDESVTTEYVLWDDYRVDGYLTPGSYRWETDVAVWADPSGAFGDEPSERFAWGFSLRVEEWPVGSATERK